MATIDEFNTIDQQIIRVIEGTGGTAPTTEELQGFHDFVVANNIDAFAEQQVQLNMSSVGSSVAEIAAEILVNFEVNASTASESTIAAGLNYVQNRLTTHTVAELVAKIGNWMSNPEFANVNFSSAAAAFNTAVLSELEASAPVEAFSLTTGLDNLAAAQTAVADFISANTEDTSTPEDGVGDGDAAEIAGVLAAAQTDVSAEVDKGVAAALTGAAYDAGSTGVKAALVADYQTELAAALTAANTTLAEEAVKVAAITGLSAAIAADDSADAAAAAALVSEGLAGNAAAEAIANMGTVNALAAVKVVDYAALTAADLVTLDGNNVVIYDVDEEEFVLFTDITEETTPGVTAVIDALNAEMNAVAATVAADAAAYETELVVDMLDLNTAAAADLVDVTALFTVSTPTVGGATIAEMRTELAILTGLNAALVTAIEAVDTAAGDFGEAEFDALLAQAILDGVINEADNDDVTDINAGDIFDGSVDMALFSALVATNSNLPLLQAAVDILIDLDNDIGGATTSETNDVADGFTAAADAISNVGETGIQDNIDALAEVLVDLDAAQSTSDDLDALDEVVEAAEEAFEAEGFETPETIDAASEFAGTVDDVFILGATAQTASILNFGLIGEDTIYLGDAVLNAGDAATDGDDAVLEVFLTEDAGNAVITVEHKVFGSNSTDAESVITLTGVALEDVSYADGFITVA